jgi:hypothetical protein
MPSLTAELAEETLRSLRLFRLPVDPLEIIKREGIELSPGSYGDKFDARIEYYKSVDEFCIYYNLPFGWRTEGRVKFSLGHELGHYYLPHHRERLRNGYRHNSITDYVSRDPLEAEADEFSADLIMPMELFRKELNNFRSGFCTLEDLGRLASRLGTSLTSTARRYCESDGEACTIYFSEGGLINWGKASEDMKRTGMYWWDFGTPPPRGSNTAAYWEKLRLGGPAEPIASRVHSEIWFDRASATELWEEVIPLGGTGRAITQLTPYER